MRILLVLVGLLLLTLMGGCGSTLSTSHLRYQDEYYVRQSGRHRFAYERRFSDGSYVRGVLEYQITDVTWGDPSQAGFSYLMKGQVTHSAEGVAKSVKSAFEIVPITEIKNAMDPANIDEVFVAEPGAGGVTSTQIYLSRVRSLKLPLVFEIKPAAAVHFEGGLKGQAREWAAEVGMVWLKDLLLRLGVLNISAAVNVVKIEETPEELQMVFHLDRGRPDVLTVVCRRGRGVVQVFGVLADGSELTIREALTAE